MWYVTTRPARLPARVSVPGLASEVSVTWTDAGAATIRASSDRDAWTALGAVHGLQRDWPAVLWRETALGHLSRWFGPQLVPLDAHVRRLGLARAARQAYARLPDADQARLDAYADGLNAALQTTAVRQAEPFVLLERTPEPWAPWHALAVERLFAWLGTDDLGDAASRAPEVRAFRETDALLRRWLHLHGLRRSVAWAARDSRGTVLVHRLVTGATAVPTVQEVTIRRSNRPPLTASTLPGAPVLLSGVSGGHAWAVLPLSASRLTRRALSPPMTWHERVAPSSGPERLLSVYRLGDTLPLVAPGDSARLQQAGPASALPDTTAPDSTWAVAWSGFRAGSDARTWLQLANDAPRALNADTAFTLFSGARLQVDTSGAWSVQGRPPPTPEDVPRGVVVGRSRWTRDQAASLRSLQRSSRRVRPAAWSVNDSSAWAARTLPDYLPALNVFRDSAARPTRREAVTYLRNWNATFDRSSIGASIFDAWMQAFRESAGGLPAAQDSVTAAPLRSAFTKAVQRLTVAHGPDLRQWRWENVGPHRYRFPVWSADSLVAQDLASLAATRFSTLRRPGQGHPSALGGGSSRAAPTWPAPSPAAWTGWTTPDRSALTVRRLRFDPSAFLARPLMEGERLPAVSLNDASARASTTLVPEQIAP